MIQFEARGRHSVKPLKIKKEIIKLMGDLPRIELFARKSFDDGWDYLGDELHNTRKEII